MDPFAVLDHALVVVSVIKDQIVAFKECPQVIQQTADECISCATLLGEARKNSMLPKDKLLPAVKPIDNSLSEINVDIEKFKANQSSVVGFFRSTSILETLQSHRTQLRNNLKLLQTVVQIKPHPARIIPDEDAKMFWVNHFGDLLQVNYSELGVALSSRFPNAALGKYGKLLEKLLDLNGNGDVSLLEFSKFVLWFRPFVSLPENLEAVMKQATFHFTPGFDFVGHLKDKNFCIKFSDGNIGGLSIYFKEDGVLKGRRLVDNLGLQEQDDKVLWEQHTESTLGKFKNLKAFLDAHTDIFGCKCCEQYFHHKGGVEYDNSTSTTAVSKGPTNVVPSSPSNQSKEPLKTVSASSSASENKNDPGYTVLMKKDDFTDVCFMVESEMFLALYTDQKFFQKDPMSGNFLFISSFTLLKPVPRGISFELAGDKYLILIPSEEKGAELFKRIQGRVNQRNQLTNTMQTSGLYSVS